MKKTFYILSLALAAIGFGACSDKNNGDEPTPNPTPATEVSLQAGADGLVQSYDFNASAAWRSSSSESWVTVTPNTGDLGSSRVTVTVAANTTYAERTAKVTIGTTMLNQPIYVINVTQAAKEKGDEPEPPADPLAPVEEDYPMVGNMESDGFALVAKIKVGWNIGNTLEASNGETSWGNPKVTPELIQAVKDAGFNAIRIPVRWYPHADADMNIKEDFLARVKEVVDYCVDRDMYVILNSHHDNWYDRLPVDYDADAIKLKFASMWTQIARYFRDYDEHLIFAGTNEVVRLNTDGSENWGDPTKAHQTFLNDMMKLFVEHVRATSGNNSVRCLMIQPWAANPDPALNGNSFKMPKDRVEGRLIFEYHHYTWTYSTEAAGADQNKYFWGEPYKDYSPWFPDGEKEEDWRCDKLKEVFIDKGYPVIMAEFGAVQHNKSSNEAVCDESRAYYLKTVVSKARQRGIPGFYWDNNCFTTDGENFGIFDRKNGNTVPPRAQIALDGIMAGLED